MNRAENSDSIPIDLILEILSRLPSKSVWKFHCVSKLWRYMLSRPYFTELYLTRSSTRPRLLFAVGRVGEELHLYSSPQPQVPCDKLAAAAFHTTFPARPCVYSSGLILFPGNSSREEYMDAMPTMICNPITGQHANLPKLINYHKSETFLGFDPIEKQFKVLKEYFPFPRDHKILTLGVGTLRWRSRIDCPYLYPLSEGICIDGVLYYLAYNKLNIMVTVCFDVRSEEFKFIKAECFCDESSLTKLINYKGKLGGISWKSDETDAIELRMWVLHDVVTQEWSKYVYPLPENEVINLHNFSIAGMTTRGEIVLAMIYTFKPFYLFYFNPEKNSLRMVEIQGFREDLSRVKVFVDHVEDFNFLRRD